ncbi:MAG: hypothetical protein H0V89_13005 [Deltaproteobacteria bacterium]|nr:hypothetical protein [Deltaproteobacteria bacterium]
MRMADRWMAIAVVLVSGRASAAEYWLEGPANPAKSEASAQELAGEKAGFETKVVRRYVEDQGWRYVVVSEGLQAEAEARTAAAGLAGAITAPVTVFTRDGRNTQQVAVVEGSGPKASPVVPPVEIEVDPEVAKILDRAVAAHGGPSGGAGVVQRASSVRFEYERQLEGGLRVRHVYARRGADEALQVRVVEGSGIDSETRLVSGSAWLQTGRDAFATQDAQRAKELLAQASPQGIIPFVLVFGAAADTRSEFTRLERGENVEVGAVQAESLRFEGDRSTGPMTLAVDPKTGLVRQVSFEDGDLVHQFDDYAEVAKGLVSPRKITTWKEGKLVETTLVSTLVLDGPVPDAALARPAP